jgi:hypothetical protein
MPALTVDIGAETYDVYADVDFADIYLAADVLRSPIWDALTVAGDKEKALVTATRLLTRLQWKDGVPDITAPPAEVQQAAALLAADIAAQPKLGDSASSGSNVKSVGAGPARVEFFRPVEGNVLPSAAFDLLRDLLGLPLSTSDDPSLDNVAFGSSGCYPSRFDPRDYDQIGGGGRYPYPPQELEWW